MKAHRLLDPIMGLLLRLRRRKEAKGVLLVSFGGLGDTVLFALVLPRLLELAKPDEPVTVLLRSDAARMAFVFPHHVAVRKVDIGRLRQPGYRWRLFTELFAAHYRLVVATDFLRHPDLDEALVAACAAPETAAMEPRAWAKYDRRLQANRRLYGRLFDSGAANQDKVVRWSRFADFLTGRACPAPVVRLPAEALPPPARLAAPTVVIQPFSAVKAKQSRPELYRAIVAALPAGWQVRIAGHPSDLERNPEFRPLLELPSVSFDPAPFAELASTLQAARLVVSVDTACMHLAAAAGVPTLCLASAAYVGEIVPYAPEITPANLRFLWQPVECAGCLGDCRKPAVDGMYPCVAALDGAMVVETVRAMIGEAGA
jgi:ADP-heptose:LPS heptosyltransferase